jgi:hypothetical protein
MNYLFRLILLFLMMGIFIEASRASLLTELPNEVTTLSLLK